LELQRIIISNVHNRGFAFAILESTGAHVFIPPFVALAQELVVGMTVNAKLVPNQKDLGEDKNPTPWQCIDISSVDGMIPVEPEPARKTTADEMVEHYITESAGGYLTTSDIAEGLRIDHNTAANSANRLFSNMRIAKAKVYNRDQQERASVILWAASANCFVNDD
tara:strand:+ start:7443 stop:7940 length:498 start_codon:yes stop_codon:yes gene_type:complete